MSFVWELTWVLASSPSLVSPLTIGKLRGFAIVRREDLRREFPDHADLITWLTRDY